MGYLTSVAFPTLGKLTKNLGPRVGTFAFLRRGIGLGGGYLIRFDQIWGPHSGVLDQKFF